MIAEPPEAATRPRHATIHALRVAAVEPITEDAVAIEFEVPAELADEYRFLHGQHVSLRCTDIGDDARRSYSICTTAGSQRLRVAVKRLPGGVFSAHAHERLRPGDVLEVVTPTGRFNTPLDPAQARHYAMIAAGSGITPILSILSTVLETEPRSSVTLIYGNRNVASIMFLEELEDLKNLHADRFALYHVLSREEQEVELFNGRIEGERLRAFLDHIVAPSGVDEWFICGPREMIDSTRAQLADRGVEAQHVHFELFHTGEQPRLSEPSTSTASAEDVAQITIVLDGRSSTFALSRRGERVLDAALRVRPDAPYACKGGVCGTCRAKLVEGTVEMEQCYALEQSEVDAGFVLACQSHPTSDRVVLDFDQ
jgi:ring-1,2-phenylacetyl-CoA epoxidase subunit PaaE